MKLRLVENEDCIGRFGWLEDELKMKVVELVDFERRSKVKGRFRIRMS